MTFTIEEIKKMLEKHWNCYKDRDCDLVSDYPEIVKFLLSRVEELESKINFSDRLLKITELAFQAARNVAIQEAANGDRNKNFNVDEEIEWQIKRLGGEASE